MYKRKSCVLCIGSDSWRYLTEFSITRWCSFDTSLFCASQTNCPFQNKRRRVFIGDWRVPPHREHGEEKETSPHRGNGSKDSGAPRIKIAAQGVPEVRPGLWDDEAALHGEEAACVGLAGRPQGEPSLLPLGGHEDVRIGSPFYPKVVAGGARRAQLLAD